MILVALGRFIQYLVLLVTFKASTTLLAPPEMGKVSLVVTTVGFFAMFFINPVGMFINRRFINWNAKGIAQHYLAYFWLYLLLMSLLADLIVLSLVVLQIINISIDVYALLFLVGGTLFFGTVNQTVIPTLTLLGYRRWFIGLTVATSLLGLLTAAVLTMLIARDAQLWLSGILFGQFAVGLMGFYIFYQKLASPSKLNLDTESPTLSRAVLLRLFHFAWPIAIAVGFAWLQSQAYRYQLMSSVGLAQLGLFVAGFGISAGLIAGFDSMVTTYFGPIFYRRLSNMPDKYHGLAWQHYANSVIPPLVLTGFLIIALAPQLTKILLGPLYQDSGIYIVWGALAEVARTATGVYGLGAHARMNTRLLIVPNLLGAIVALVGVQLLVPLYGVESAGAALFLAAIVALVSSALVNRKHISVRISFRQLAKAVLLGMVLIFLADLLEYFEILHPGFVRAVFIASIVGFLFLLSQWYLLRDFTQLKLHGE